MRAALIAALTVLATTVPGMAQDENYRNCIGWVAADPNKALSDATGWRDSGGGLAARHCRALALAALDRFGEAAQEAQSVAASMPQSQSRVNLLVQAGEFHLAAANAGAARQAFDEALLLAPDDREGLDGRSRALAASGDMAGALVDLNRLLALDPGNVEALALHAAALRQTGDLAGAMVSAERAVQSDPGSALAYFERGAARVMSGDQAGARADWQQASALDPGGPTGELANTNLAKLGP